MAIGNLAGGSFSGHPDLTLTFIPPVKLESEAYFPCRSINSSVL
jgi:hypothetical protein